ncbi:PaaI family thioesterase [archaeon]|nr:MAG: PaaI family thioesterase [archaeon]
MFSLSWTQLNSLIFPDHPFLAHRMLSNFDKKAAQAGQAQAATSHIGADIMVLQLSSDFVGHIKWMNDVLATPGAEKLRVKEWDEEDWREEGGFKGFDFVHGKHAPARVLQYVLLPPHSAQFASDPYPRLVGAVHFTPRAESHRGLCHGGSMCAIMDDAMGWMGFCVTGQALPWSGYTVQVNTSLRKGIKVGALLKLEAWVTRKEGTRKYWIHARLSDPTTNEVHCEGDGLFLINRESVKETDTHHPTLL